MMLVGLLVGGCAHFVIMCTAMCVRFGAGMVQSSSLCARLCARIRVFMCGLASVACHAWGRACVRVCACLRALRALCALHALRALRACMPACLCLCLCLRLRVCVCVVLCCVVLCCVVLCCAVLCCA